MCEPSFGATVIQGGDRVLLTFHGDMTREMADQMRRVLDEIFPDVVFVMVDKVTSVVVQRRDT